MSTPSDPAPVNPNDPGRGPAVIGVTWALTIICIIVVAARFYVRKRVVASHSLAAEDWLMLVAVILQVLFECLMAESYRWGLGKHNADLTESQLLNVLKWNWIATTPAILVSIVARISITILLVKVFGVHVWFKWFLIICTGIQSVVAGLVIIFIWAQVTPVQALWDPDVVVKHRWDSKIEEDTIYLAQSLFTFSDLSYVLLPVMILWKLNMPMRRKLAIICLMALSLFTMTASIIKTIVSKSVSNTKHTDYNGSETVLWSGIEQSLVIIMGCIPTLSGAAVLQTRFWQRVRSIGSRMASSVGAGTRSSHHNTYDASMKDGTDIEMRLTPVLNGHDISDGSSIHPILRGCSRSLPDLHDDFASNTRY